MRAKTSTLAATRLLYSLIEMVLSNKWEPLLSVFVPRG